MNLQSYSGLVQMERLQLRCLEWALLSQIKAPTADQSRNEIVPLKQVENVPLGLRMQRGGDPAELGWGEGSTAWGLSSLVWARACTAYRCKQSYLDIFHGWCHRQEICVYG